MRKVWELLKETFSEWLEDKAARLAAALSYYTVLSLPPILLIVVAVVGLVWGRPGVENAIVEQARGLVGEEAGGLVASMIGGAFQNQGAGIAATIFGIGALLFSATGAFAQLQEALNTMWEVQVHPKGGIMNTIRRRVLSFGILLVIAFFLLASLVISAGLSAAGTFLESVIPDLLIVAQIVSQVVSLAAVTLLFALMFKYLPDVKIAWGDVWIGALVTAVLFTVGKYLIGLYLGTSAAASAYGAAGALVLLLLWIYYTTQILFLGAEFTQVYARLFGSRIVPATDAVPLTEEARAQQGIPHKEATAVVTPAQSATTAAVQAENALPVQPKVPLPALPPPRASRLAGLKRLLPGVLGFAAGILTGVVARTRDEDR